MTEANEPPYPSGRYAAYVIGVLFFTYVIAIMDRQMVNLLLPSIKVHLGLSDTQLSLMQGMAFASAFAIAGLPLGWIVDHSNRRNLLAAGAVFWSLATLACGLAETYWQLVAARVAVGIGEACLGPACVSLIADYFRPAQRGRAMGAAMTGSTIGASSSLFFGGMLLSSLTQGGLAALVPHGWAPWQVVFASLTAPGLLAAVLVASLREPPRRGQPKRAARDMPKLRLVDGFRRFPMTMTLFFASVATYTLLTYAMTSWTPTLLIRVYGMKPAEVGAIYGTIMLASSVGAGLSSGFVSDALARRWPLSGRVLIPLIALPVEICALVAFMFADNTTAVFSALTVSAFTASFIGFSFNPAVQELFPNQLRGRASAVVSLVGNVVGVGMGPTLVALVTDRVFKDEMRLQQSMVLIGLSAAILAFLVALVLPRFFAQARRIGLEPSPAATSVAATAAPGTA